MLTNLLSENARSSLRRFAVLRGHTGASDHQP